MLGDYARNAYPSECGGARPGSLLTQDGTSHERALHRREAWLECRMDDTAACHKRGWEHLIELKDIDGVDEQSDNT